MNPARRPSARPGRRCSGRRRRSGASCSDPSCRPRRSGPGRRRTCASRLRPRRPRPAIPDRVAAAGLGLLEGQRGGRQQLGHRFAMVRERADADADGQRQPFRGVELEGVVGKGGPSALEAGPSAIDSAGGREEQEFVRAVATQDDAGRQVRARSSSTTVSSARSPAAWPYVSLSSRKLSMSTSATAKARALVPRPVDRPGDGVDQRAVVRACRSTGRARVESIERLRSGG